MTNPPGPDHHGSELPEQAQASLREELAVLRALRDRLRGDSVAEDHRASDSGDRAEALRRADDVFRVEDRIREIQRLLTAGSPGRAASGQPPALAEGTVVTLRFPDGDEETFYASAVLDTAPEDTQAELLGLSSPLAEALAGHSPGDTITWSTPTGIQRAELAQIRSASP